MRVVIIIEIDFHRKFLCVERLHLSKERGETDDFSIISCHRGKKFTFLCYGTHQIKNLIFSTINNPEEYNTIVVLGIRMKSTKLKTDIFLVPKSNAIFCIKFRERISPHLINLPFIDLGLFCSSDYFYRFRE